MSHIWIQPTGGALGADVHGVDLSQPVDEPTFKRIAAAWAEHLVLRFSGQKIDDGALMKFSARFGELDRVPIAAANFDRGDSDLVGRNLRGARRGRFLAQQPLAVRLGAGDRHRGR